jgi:vitamin B12 transporter
LVTGTKVRGLVATGFKAPTLYQLFSPADPLWLIGGGNADLKPEKSVSYEYGVDQYLFGERLIASATYFHAIYKDLIDAVYHPDTWTTDRYANVGKARVHGIEASGKIRPHPTLTVQGGFTYQKTKNLGDDRDLLRRPERKFYLDCLWQPIAKLRLNLDMRYNGPMSDYGGYKIKEYTVVNLVANYNVTKNISAYFKINNVFNQHYEEITGYTMPGFAAYGGTKAEF